MRQQVIYILKPRRTRRQLSSGEEVIVERVIAFRRPVDVWIAVNPVPIPRVVHAHQRSSVVGCNVPPIFQISNEVVNTTVGSCVTRA